MLPSNVDFICQIRQIRMRICRVIKTTASWVNYLQLESYKITINRVNVLKMPIIDLQPLHSLLQDKTSCCYFATIKFTVLEILILILWTRLSCILKFKFWFGKKMTKSARFRCGFGVSHIPHSTSARWQWEKPRQTSVQRLKRRKHTRVGSISPLPMSIFTDISEPKISVISTFFTAALFGLLTLEDAEKSA